ncbi:MAG: hypothetical protein QM820_23350 [Minicystis sp.]
MVARLAASSASFGDLWRALDVSDARAGTKTLSVASLGDVTFDVSAFSVEGRPYLSLVVFAPVSPEDEARIRRLISGAPHPH